MSCSSCLVAIFVVLQITSEVKCEFIVNDNSWRNCLGQPTLTVKIQSFENKPFEKTERVFVVNQTFPLLSVVSTDISICSLKDHPDACSQESVGHYWLPCSIIIEKNRPWSNFIQSFEPKLKCPLKPGVYRSNAPAKDVWKIFENDLKHVQSGTYQVLFDVDFGSKKLICWEIEFEVKRVST
ncbi:uncharacterized protein LOC123683472 [Harmonia axyridis]|uniref:uncharacterized protein LOC123683472 n=1 Tax=Harmonia axyridis TaxID=115357 RepID=UPI001E27592D|nr:uncharacterized protein LOC123683472 [Harmonia axyridis]